MRWTDPAGWHLTLLFVGLVEPGRVSELVSLVDEVAATIAPYPVRAEQGGGRLQRSDGTAWLELTLGADALIEAATRLASACPAGIADEPLRTRSAHLTLARRTDRTLIDAFVSQAHGPLGVGWHVDRLQLVRSHLEPAGARYETVHVATL